MGVSLSGILRKAFTSWGMVLAIIPFLILFIYGAAVVSRSVQGAVKAPASVIGLFIVSALVFCGLAILLAWFDEKRLGGGG